MTAAPPKLSGNRGDARRWPQLFHEGDIGRKTQVVEDLVDRLALGDRRENAAGPLARRTDQSVGLKQRVIIAAESVGPA